MQGWVFLSLNILLPGLAAYAVGSVPYGYVFGRLKGLDIRRHGSGNIGATNVWRIMGKGWGIATFALDFLKVPAAALILIAAHHFHPFLDSPTFYSGEPTAWRFAALVGAVLGHNFPVWLGFRGGKGIATSIGGIVWLLPKAFPWLLLVWVLVFAASRYVALASIAGAVAFPVATWILYTPPLAAFAAVLGGLAVWRHRSNIQRLLSGTEHRWGASPPQPQ